MIENTDVYYYYYWMFEELYHYVVLETLQVNKNIIKYTYNIQYNVF